MHKPFEAALNALADEFRRASAMFPPLYHEQVYDTMGNDDWHRAFENWRTTEAATKTWQWWHGPHVWRIAWKHKPIGKIIEPTDWYGRFYGFGEGLEEFQRLAESGYLVLVEMDIHDSCRTPGWPGFLEFIYHIAAQQPTPFIRVTEGMLSWGDGDWLRKTPEPVGAMVSEKPEPIGEQQNALGSEGTAEAEHHPMGALAPAPWVRSLRLNLFTVAQAAMRMILDLNNTLFLSDPDGLSQLWGLDISPAGVAAVVEGPTPKIETAQPPTQPSSEVMPDYLWRFESGRWHLRFRVDASPPEEDWFEPTEGLRIIAIILLQHPHPVPCLTLSPHGRAAAPEDTSRLRDRGARSVSADFGHDDIEPSRTQQPESPEPGDRWLDERIAEVEDQHEIAESTGSPDAPRLEQELKDLEETRRISQGSSPAVAEAARGRVNQRLKVDRSRIGKTMPHLALYLKCIRLDPLSSKLAYACLASLPLDWHVEGIPRL
jgi:hypothetical protein